MPVTAHQHVVVDTPEQLVVARTAGQKGAWIAARQAWRTGWQSKLEGRIDPHHVIARAGIDLRTAGDRDGVIAGITGDAHRRNHKVAFGLLMRHGEGLGDGGWGEDTASDSAADAHAAARGARTAVDVKSDQVALRPAQGHHQPVAEHRLGVPEGQSRLRIGHARDVLKKRHQLPGRRRWFAAAVAAVCIADKHRA